MEPDCGRRVICRGAGALIAIAAALAAHGPNATAAQADLVIESVTHAPAAPARGDAVTFTVIVRNQGDAHAQDFSTAFHLDSATEPTAGDYGDARVTIGDLPAGAAKAIGFEFEPPLDAGAFKAWAYADYGEDMAESDENNNAGPAGGYDWSVAASPEPDLFIASMTCSPSVSETGELVTFTVTVTNGGGSDAGAFSVGFWSDPNSTPDIDDVPEDSMDVAGLAVGASIPLQFSLTAPGTGRYWACAYADRRNGGEVTESVETNNVASVWWRVISLDIYEPDGDFASATPISGGDSQIHSIHTAGDNDYLTFETAVAAGVVVKLVDGRPWPDVEAVLYDDVPVAIAGSDLEGILRSPELQPGTYFLRVAGDFPSRLVEEYTIQFGPLVEADGYEPDNSFALASSITPGVTQGRSIHWEDDYDYVQFTLSEAADTVVEAGAVPDDARLYLYDSTQAFIGSGSRTGDSLRIERAALPAGTYYARVTSYLEPYAYTLAVTTSAPEKPDLIIEAFTCDPSPAAPGQLVTFTATVTNTGGGDAGAFNVGFWSDESSSPILLSVPEQDADVGGLAAGASVDLDFQVTAPALGNFRAWVFADRRDGTSEIDEFDEQNNHGTCYWDAMAADDYEVDDTFAQAGTIYAGEVRTHSIHVVGDQDYFAFTLGAAGFVGLTLDCASSYAYVCLYDGSQTLLASGSAAREPGLLEAGTYYVMVEDYYSDETIARYDIGLVVGGDAYEPDNSFAEATPITAGNPQTHSIAPANDLDFVKFTLAGPSDVSIEAAEQFLDVVLYLYDPGLTEVAHGEGYPCVVAGYGLPAGTYYVMARGDNLNWPLGSYVLHLTAGSPPKPDLAFETFGLSPPYLGPGDTATFTATVANRGSVDAGAFSVGFWSDWPQGSSPGITDAPEQETGLSGLAAGETAALTFSVTAPAWGSLRSFVYADCGGGAGDVTEFDEQNNLEYRSWSVYAEDTYEVDDTFALARPIVVGEVQTHSIHVPGDVDHIKFTLSETTSISIAVTPGSHLPPWEGMRAYLFDDSEALLYSNVVDDPIRPSYDPVLNAFGLAAGTYYVKVDFSEDRPIAEYELSFDVLVPDAYEADDCYAEASTISAGETQSRSLHVPEDVDYVTFSLDQASNVVISLEGEGLSRGLRGPGGTLVTWPDAPAVLSPGTYYVLVAPAYNVDVVPAYTLTLEAIPYEPPPGNMDGCSAGGDGGGAASWIAALALALLAAARCKRSRRRPPLAA